MSAGKPYGGGEPTYVKGSRAGRRQFGRTRRYTWADGTETFYYGVYALQEVATESTPRWEVRSHRTAFPNPPGYFVSKKAAMDWIDRVAGPIAEKRQATYERYRARVDAERRVVIA